MAGTITAIEPQQRSITPRRGGGGQRFNVFVDGRYALSLDASLAVQLRLEQELDDATLASLVQADEQRRALDAAYTLLSYRPRSAREITTRLQQKGYSPEAIAATRARLDAFGLVDDAAFARYWVEQRQTFRPRGAAALRHELRAKGVGAPDIAAALPPAEGENDAAYRAALPRARSLARLDRPTFRRRLGAYLQRRGFSYAASAAAVDRLWSEVTDE